MLMIVLLKAFLVLYITFFFYSRHLSSQLDELEKAIEAMMENDLVHVAMADMKARIDHCNKIGLNEEGERISSPECIDTEVSKMVTVVARVAMSTIDRYS